MKTLTTNTEDYLERIYELIEKKGYARVSDIAEALKLTRPTVSIMVQRLSKGGFLTYERYRGLTLTERGEEVARTIRTRHVLLTEFFGLLGVDRSVVAHDVEGIEHHVSTETLEKLERLVEHWRRYPAKLKAALAKQSSTAGTTAGNPS